MNNAIQVSTTPILRTATRIKTLADFRGYAALYKLQDSDTFVAVSTIVFRGIAETMVFPSNQMGEVTDWNEIAGGKGLLLHADALEELGYEVEK